MKLFNVHKETDSIFKLVSANASQTGCDASYRATQTDRARMDHDRRADDYHHLLGAVHPAQQGVYRHLARKESPKSPPSSDATMYVNNRFRQCINARGTSEEHQEPRLKLSTQLAFKCPPSGVVSLDHRSGPPSADRGRSFCCCFSW
ncbi:hypothetical protein QR680_003145 [Steinernema hermaphroditum]|uniref:Uncharacterized protein n=1 Tax=Steinernema hermaphroditum TaxID=289476 RepID=A0AA39H5M0_9BILA|nr:hypothetical protein QR680_003145 [Steinernema hermaphroditum]